MERPTLPRSISSANLECTKHCMAYIERDLCEESLAAMKGTINHFNITPSFTLTIPPLVKYSHDFKDYVYRHLVDHTVKEDLERDKIINWCKGASTLIPLSTIGDGNCLLHAASLGMWGFQDRKFILRKAVHDAVSGANSHLLYRRWLNWYKQELESMHIQFEKQYAVTEWNATITNVSMHMTDRGVLQGLDQFHVFVLANVLRRPIVLYSQPKILSSTEAVTLQKLSFQGLYLPLLWNPKDCKRLPLPLAFNGGHFVSLSVPNEVSQFKNGRGLLLPIADCNGVEFPVMFKLPEEKDWDTRRAYLDLTYVRKTEYSYSYNEEVMCAEMVLTEVPTYMKPLLIGYIDKCFDAYSYEQSLTKLNQATNHHGSWSSENSGGNKEKCRNGCGFYGDAALNGFCSQCHKRCGLSSRQLVTGTGGEGTSGIRCSNDGCTRPCRPDMLGMCEECFRSKKTSKDSPVSESKIKTAPMDDTTRPCRGRGCEFTGTKEQSYYCSQCYKKYHDNPSPRPRTSRHDNTPHPLAPVRKVDQRDVQEEPKKCPVCNEFYGAVEYNGKCHGCFMKSTEQRTTCIECQQYAGNVEYNGLCNNCHLTKITNRASDPAPSRPHPLHDKPRDVLIHDSPADVSSPYPPPNPYPPLNPVNLPSLSPVPVDTPDAIYSQPVRQNSSSSSSNSGVIAPYQQQGCFICNIEHQQLTVSNVICQAHAREVRDLWIQSRRGQPGEGNRVGVAVGGAMGYNRRGSGYNVGGAQNIAAGFQSESETQPPKQLCPTPGCSFLSVAEFNGYCKNCYHATRV